MDSRRGHGFGWTTPCPADGLAVSLRHVDALWAAYFPAHAGYALDRRELPDGLRLVAIRGDFHAEVEVAGGTRRGAPKLRLCGTAGSRRVAATERAASSVVERLRLLGSGLGIAFVVFICSRLLNTPTHFMVDALFVLGGLLMVVMLMVLVLTGAGLGGWVGEQLVAGRWASTVTRAARPRARPGAGPGSGPARASAAGPRAGRRPAPAPRGCSPRASPT